MKKLELLKELRGFPEVVEGTKDEEIIIEALVAYLEQVKTQALEEYMDVTI